MDVVGIICHLPEVVLGGLQVEFFLLELAEEVVFVAGGDFGGGEDVFEARGFISYVNFIGNFDLFVSFC